jgi:sigma-B regulation protein RsbU (phosphoserine phosphatase)
MSDLIDDLEDLYENAPCGYLTLKQARIVRVNQTFLTWTGYSAAELVGKSLHDLLNMAGRIFYETHIAPLLRMQGFFAEVALDLVTRSEGRIPVIANAVERRDAEGNPLFTRLVLFKATERRRYERNLVDSLKTEKETSELREQFIAVLGHDLRNPLASIAAGARILEREANRTEKDRLVIGMLQTTVSRMSGLIDNVLDFARGRLGGGISLSRDASLPLEPVLRQIVDELRTPEREIRVEFEIDRPVDCDRSRIGQLVSNLIGNALTHGAIDKPVKVFASTKTGVFELWVSNGGEPISRAAMEQLFQPFFRGEIRDSQQGLGLGLYIAWEIARAHDGALTVDSSPEETRFTFRMPLASSS